MSIDEFMRDIAPKMWAGWVFIDNEQRICFSARKPHLIVGHCPDGKICECWDIVGKILPFNIEPVDDWTQSLRKIGVE